MLEPVPENAVNATVPPSGRRLSALDRCMATANSVLQGLGAVGLDTQMHLWLAGRLSGAALQAAVTRMSRRHPILTARLVKSPRGVETWRYRPDAAPALVEVELASAAPAAVHDYASRLLSTRYEPAEHDPLQFHLLHRPGAGDVVVLQYTHLVMDNGAATYLVRELDRCFSGAAFEGVPVVEPRGLAREYLHRFPHSRRRQAGLNLVQRLWEQFRSGAMLLNPAARHSPKSGEVRVLSACLDADAVTALRFRLIGVCGYPAVSMAILASAFRLLNQHALPARTKKPQILATGLGLDLGLRDGDGPIFQNLMSVVPIFVLREEVHDRDALTRMLSQQFQDALRNDVDLGVLRFALYPGVRPHNARWLLELFHRHGFSFWFAHFGVTDSCGDTLGGIPIDAVRFAGHCWPPLGFTLLTNQHRGRLHFQVTHIPDIVPEATAEKMLQGIVEDCRG